MTEARIGVVANTAKPRAREALGRVASCAAKAGLEVVADGATLSLADPAWGVIPASDAGFAGCRAILVLGGDGTILNAIHGIGSGDTPVLGINLGSLGYLAAVEPEQIDEAVKAVAEGRMDVSRRRLLSATVCGAAGCGRPIPRHALNEVVLARGSGRMVRIALHLNGVHVTDYSCDGIIVATPTGSTAYSLSAGGPLVMPDARAMVITMICPHALSSRPIVVSDNASVSLRPIMADVPLALEIDGEEIASVDVGQSVDVAFSPSSASIAFIDGRDAGGIIARKLGWTGSAPRISPSAPGAASAAPGRAD